jgi:hypothetical protein
LISIIKLTASSGLWDGPAIADLVVGLNGIFSDPRRYDGNPEAVFPISLRMLEDDKYFFFSLSLLYSCGTVTYIPLTQVNIHGLL